MTSGLLVARLSAALNLLLHLNLPPHCVCSRHEAIGEHCEFIIDETFSVPGGLMALLVLGAGCLRR